MFKGIKLFLKKIGSLLFKHRKEIKEILWMVLDAIVTSRKAKVKSKM